MKPRIFSGIQPSGTLHIGNYLGAVKNWVTLQEKYESIFCVVDLHAITVPQKPEELRKNTLELAKVYLASGINTQEATIFVQSHIPEHTELAWILNTITKNGDLTRMTQFKDKALVDFDQFENTLKELTDTKKYPAVSKKVGELVKKLDLGPIEMAEKAKRHSFETAHHFFKIFKDRFNKINTGLFDYPVLMAADILLYDTNVVPVGEDQLQHVELARTLARRFNQQFGETFTEPEPFIVKEGMRIMGLDDPSKKMSKSAASEFNYIALTDSPDVIREKIKRAVTDSGKSIKYSDDQPAIRNLINIFSLLDNVKPGEVEKIYKGKSYSEFKSDLAEVIVGFLSDFQQRYNAIDDKDVLNTLEQGREQAKKIAEKKMKEVREKVGFLM